MSRSEFQIYSEIEKTHWWFSGRRSILRTYLDCIPVSHRNSVLEVGCGTGGNLLYLFDNFPIKDGVEIDPIALALAQEKLGKSSRIENLDANDLSSIQRKYDCLAFCDVLYHKNIRDLDQIMIDAGKLLTEKGYLLITDGAFNFLSGVHSENVNSARRFRRPELVKFLRQNGFEICFASYWGVFLFFLIFIKRRVLDRLFKAIDCNPENEYSDPPLIGHFLEIILKIESKCLKLFSLPFGASLVILARKKSNG